jgi:hypothetical protein
METTDKLYKKSEIFEAIDNLIKIPNEELEEADLPDAEKFYNIGYIMGLANLENEIEKMIK